MTGWKTKLGCISSILTGVALGIKEIIEGTYNFAPAMGFIVTGVTAWGVAHKVEKAGL